MGNELSSVKIPLWYWVLVILSILPVFLVPMYLSGIEAAEYELKKLFIWFYVPYIAVASILTLLCYKYDRKIMSWILLVIMIMTHVSMYALMFCDI